jgi:hypothetical protein
MADGALVVAGAVVVFFLTVFLGAGVDVAVLEAVEVAVRLGPANAGVQVRTAAERASAPICSMPIRVEPNFITLPSHALVLRRARILIRRPDGSV